MGSVYKRGRVFWIKFYRHGKPHRESAKTIKESEAKRLLKLREGQVAEGKLPSLRVEKICFEELAEDFINDYKINSKKSLSRAKLSVRNLAGYFGNMRVVSITTDKIRAYIGKRQTEGKANGTINRELAALKRIFRLGKEAGKVTNVPHIPHLKEDNVRTGFFEHHEYIALRDALADYLKGPFVLAYYTGMRRAEVLNLKWEQVDLIDKKIVLNPQDTKTNKARIIYLANEPYHFMLMQKQWRDSRFPNCPYVFFNEHGKKIGDFRKAWASACKEVGLDNKLFHDLRRTGVRNMVRTGIDRDVAKRISGHKTDSVFSRYNVVSEGDLKNAAEKMNKYQSTGTVLGTISKSAKVDISEMHGIISHGPLAQLVEQRTLNP